MKIGFKSLKHTVIAASIMSVSSVSSGAALEEIVVTAQKREQNLQNIGVSVTALSSSAIEENGITDLGDMDTLVPGLNFGQSGNDARPAIRGARTESTSVLQDPTVAFYVDGIYRSRTSQALAAITDIERVEILRGPQGTLSGRNSFGGSVNIISKKPVIDEFDFGMSGVLGQYSRTGLSGYLNLSANDVSAFRLTWDVDQHDGKFTNIFDEQNSLRDKDQSYVRAQYLFEPSEAFNLLVRASDWTSDGAGNAAFGHFTPGSPFNADGRLSSTGTVTQVNLRDGSGVVPLDGSPAFNTLAVTDPFVVDNDGPLSQQTEQQTFDIELNWYLESVDVKLMLSYADFERELIYDSDFSPFPGIVDRQFDSAETYTQELQLVSNSDGAFQWVAGLFFLQDDTVGIFNSRAPFQFQTGAVDFSPLVPSGGNDGQPVDFSNPRGPEPSFFSSLSNVDTDSSAIYAQGTYDISDSLSLTAGIRYTEDDKSSESCNNFNRCAISGTLTQPVFTPNADGLFLGEETFSKTTYLVELGYDFNDDTFGFARVSTGFQAGGFNSSPNSVTGEISFDPQLVTAYETGLKMGLWEDAARLNLTLYHNDFEDLLGQNFVTVGGSTTAVSTNAGNATATGLEVEFDWLPTEELTLGIVASITDSEVTNFITGGRGEFVDLPRVNGSDPLTGSGPRFFDASGNPVALTPDFTLGVSASYLFDLGDNGNLTPSINLYYSDDYCANDRCRPFDIQDSYIKADVRLNWESVDGNWYSQLFLENATNEEILNRSVVFSGGVIAQNYADPRTWGLRIGYRLN